jgi:serine/threonine protein kinase
MAQVFHARRLGAAGFQRDVAIKRVRTGLAHDDSFQRMFVDEARLAARLRHPGIAAVYDLYEEPGGCCLVMEYVEGRSLREVLQLAARKGTTVSHSFACYCAAEVAEALHYAHTLQEAGVPLNIVHRDVSPPNIMVATGGEVKLLDFGIAYSNLEGRDRTRTDIIKGKVHYMSPEHALGDEVLDGRSDQFSLGVVLVEMLTGRRVFDGGSREAKTLHRIIAASPQEVQAATHGLPPQLQVIALRVLARERGARFHDCADLAMALREYLASLGQVFGPRQAAMELERLVAMPDAPRVVPPRLPATHAGSSGPDAALTSSHRRRVAPAASSLAGPPHVEEHPRVSGEERPPSAHRTSRAVAVARPLLILALLGVGALAIRLAADALGPQRVATAPARHPPRDTESLLPPASAGAARLIEPQPAPRPVHPTAPLTARQRAAAPVPSHRQEASPAAAPSNAAASQSAASSPRRSYATPMGTRFADTSAEEGSISPVVPRGTFLTACLTSPADPGAVAPFTAVLALDVKHEDVIVLPQGTSAVCTTQGLSGSRLSGTCDTLTVPGRASRTFSGLVYGRDKRPGLPVIGDSGTNTARSLVAQGTCFFIFVQQPI